MSWRTSAATAASASSAASEGDGGEAGVARPPAPHRLRDGGDAWLQPGRREPDGGFGDAGAEGHAVGVVGVAGAGEQPLARAGAGHEVGHHVEGAGAELAERQFRYPGGQRGGRVGDEVGKAQPDGRAFGP